MSRGRKRLTKALRRQLPAEAVTNLSREPYQNLLGFIKLLIDLDRQREIERKLSTNKP
jgi:hypothetical protein